MGSEEALGELQAELRANPPDGLAALSDEELGELAEAIRDARHLQAAELKAAGEKASRHIPWLLRGPIRKVMGG